MIENKKTEKWSSLRLDLQQFTPQEYCSGCYRIELKCTHDSSYNILLQKNGSNHHTTTPHSLVIYAKDDNEKAQKNIDYKIGSTGYVGTSTEWGQIKDHSMSLWYDGRGYHVWDSGSWIPDNHS